MKVVWLNFNVNECSCLISHSRIYEVTSRENVCSVPSILKISGTLSSRMRVRRRRSTLGYKQQIGQKNNTVWMKTDCNFRNEMGYVNGEAKLAGVDVITWPWNRNGWEKLRSFRILSACRGGMIERAIARWTRSKIHGVSLLSYLLSRRFLRSSSARRWRTLDRNRIRDNVEAGPIFGKFISRVRWKPHARGPSGNLAVRRKNSPPLSKVLIKSYERDREPVVCTLFTGSRVIGFHFARETWIPDPLCPAIICPEKLNSTLNLINHHRTTAEKSRVN